MSSTEIEQTNSRTLRSSEKITLDFEFQNCSIYCLWVAIRMTSKTAAIHHRSRPAILGWRLVVLTFGPEPGVLLWAFHRARYTRTHRRTEARRAGPPTDARDAKPPRSNNKPDHHFPASNNGATLKRCLNPRCPRIVQTVRRGAQGRGATDQGCATAYCVM